MGDLVTGIFDETGLSLPDVSELAWMDSALCAQVGGDAWYPEKGGAVLAPKRICRQCPVRAECLDYALDHNERFGVWGGLSEAERQRLRRQRKDVAA